MKRLVVTTAGLIATHQHQHQHQHLAWLEDAIAISLASVCLQWHDVQQSKQRRHSLEEVGREESC